MTKHDISPYLPRGAHAIENGNSFTFEIAPGDLLAVCGKLLEQNCELKTIAAIDERKECDAFRIAYVFGCPEKNIFLIPTIVATETFPSLTLTLHQASIFERKIYTLFGLIPEGHPDVRKVILHDENWPEDVYPLRKDFEWNTRPAEAKGEFRFRRVDGEGVYEIPVGPVHAGIIEPGHFRFSVAGEEILLLEPRLGYSHKGVEKLFETLPIEKAVKLSERISGDSSFSHSLAFCMAIEQLASVEVPARAQMLRVIYAELERIANHLGDIGAIMLDTGFNFGGAHGARLREVVLRIHDRLTGSRFLRGVNIAGGVTKDIIDTDSAWLTEALAALKTDFSEVLAIAEGNASLIERLRGTGLLPLQIAKDHGVVGVPARALGISMDTRVQYPYAGYVQLPFEIATEQTGDVHSRFFVRIKEVFSSIDLIARALQSLETGPITGSAIKSLKKNALTISCVEGWRGEIVYTVATDASGALTRVDVRDPSFLNWTALGHAGRGNMVPDFPLINKSFNLSYSGNDV